MPLCQVSDASANISSSHVTPMILILRYHAKTAAKVTRRVIHIIRQRHAERYATRCCRADESLTPIAICQRQTRLMLRRRLLLRARRSARCFTFRCQHLLRASRHALRLATPADVTDLLLPPLTRCSFAASIFAALPAGQLRHHYVSCRRRYQSAGELPPLATLNARHHRCLSTRVANINISPIRLFS